MTPPPFRYLFFKSQKMGLLYAILIFEIAEEAAIW